MKNPRNWIAVALVLAALSPLVRPARADEPKSATPAPAASAAPAAPAAAPAAAAAPTMTMKEVKQKLGMVVYPAKGQTAATQDAEELACLQWAAEQTGVTSAKPTTDAKAAGAAAAAKTDSVTQGAAVKGAAKGAAAGALFGAILGDAGTGAAVGAAGGAVAGRRARKQAAKQADANAQQKVTAEQQARLDAVKKAMSACLESKGYTVK